MTCTEHSVIFLPLEYSPGLINRQRKLTFDPNGHYPRGVPLQGRLPIRHTSVQYNCLISSTSTTYSHHHSLDLRLCPDIASAQNSCFEIINVNILLSLRPFTFQLFHAFIPIIPVLQAHLEIEASDFSLFFFTWSLSALSSSLPSLAPRPITWALLSLATHLPLLLCHDSHIKTPNVDQGWTAHLSLIHLDS